MSTTPTHGGNVNSSFWRRPLNWIRAFEAAMDYDPTQASVDRLNRQVAELKDTVRKLESQRGVHDQPARQET